MNEDDKHYNDEPNETSRLLKFSTKTPEEWAQMERESRVSELIQTIRENEALRREFLAALGLEQSE